MAKEKTEEQVEERQVNGYEIQVGKETRFVPWRASDLIPDLQLIDRFTLGMPTHEFMEAIDDPVQMGRGPILLALIATSFRAEFPRFSVERVERIVKEAWPEKITIMGDDDASPPVVGSETSTPET